MFPPKWFQFGALVRAKWAPTLLAPGWKMGILSTKVITIDPRPVGGLWEGFTAPPTHRGGFTTIQPHIRLVTTGKSERCSIKWIELVRSAWVWASLYIEPEWLWRLTYRTRVISGASHYFESSSVCLSLQQSWWSVEPLSYWSQPQRSLAAHWEWVQSSGGKEDMSLLCYKKEAGWELTLV